MENIHLVIQGIVSDKSRKIVLEKLEDVVWEEGPEFPILSTLFRYLGSNFFSPRYRKRLLTSLGYVTKEDFPYSEFLFFSYSSFRILLLILLKALFFRIFMKKIIRKIKSPSFVK